MKRQKKIMRPHGRRHSPCCLCPRPILPTDTIIILYRPGNPNGYQTGRAHLSCFEKHPIQNLNLMKKDEGLIGDGTSLKSLSGSRKIN